MSHMLSELQQYIESKQEFVWKAMSKLCRSIGKLKLSPDCWLSKILLLFYMCHCWPYNRYKTSKVFLQ